MHVCHIHREQRGAGGYPSLLSALDVDIDQRCTAGFDDFCGLHDASDHVRFAVLEEEGRRDADPGILDAVPQGWQKVLDGHVLAERIVGS